MKVSKREIDECVLAATANLRLDEERVAELLDVAAEVFMEHGFDGASTNEIARRANCSKTTLYARFPTKHHLFIAVLERRMDATFNEVFTSLPVDDPVEDTLFEFGSRILAVCLSDEKVRLERVLSMETERFPELAAHFCEIGPMRAQQELSRYLTEQIRRGRLRNEDPCLMAEHLLSLITGGPVHWRVLGYRHPHLAKNQKMRLQSALRAFLRAYATNPGLADSV